MPPTKRTSPPRATRRKPAKRRTVRRNRGRGLFLSMVLILIFVLVYHFYGDQIQHQLGISASTGANLSDNEIIVTFLDVGQAESIVIRSNNNAVLIDGGTHAQRNVVMDYLRDAGIRELCYVVATHPHYDHIGGLVTVLRRINTGMVIMPNVTHNTITFENFLSVIEDNRIPITIPTPGDVIRAGIIELTVIAPPDPHPGPANILNNASVVLRLSHGNSSFLFTGDAERELEDWMVANTRFLNSTVLNVGHHGSNTSTTEAFLNAVNPRAAVISLGENNRYGHPHPDVLDRLSARGIQIFRTDQLGTIRMLADGYEITVLSN